MKSCPLFHAELVEAARRLGVKPVLIRQALAWTFLSMNFEQQALVVGEYLKDGLTEETSATKEFVRERSET